MVIAIIVLFLVVVFILFLHLYAKWFWWRIEQQPELPSNHGRRRRRSRFVFAPGQDPAFTMRRGLDPAILRSIPVLVFDPEDFKDGLECAVCLSELLQGEKARLLPKCNHGFHVECIDMWFQSHSTCPICRNPVDDVQQGSNSLSVEIQSAEVIDLQGPQENLVSGYSTESPNFPTNVLFWGNETQVSTGGACLEEGPSSSSSSTTTTSTLNSGRPAETVVIDIEEGIVEEEEKSPAPPTRLRSFKRLLSREKKVTSPTTATSTCSSSNCSGGSCDDEQVRR
ncbi:hypothetical protein ACOSP7_019877 [Xanthoceras sorbifolium]|uniref:RING-type E3 ubiquitin transferase n=1 Tax=Xanthoceras sorbifolium TaxID=99658 RepID=A0ABQ8HMS0_9ROSI|nr:hypothetical protein JRO89_XS09G0239000 [Xanthoceras sorbifolium]